MKRNLEPHILNDLPNKIVLVTGPRQCGKTTLAKQLYSSFDYFNFDSAEDRLTLQEKSWNRAKKLIIFDELHKKKEWKRWLQLLENLYIIFRVTPYSNNVARSLLKEPKFYFYDNT